MTSAIRKRLSLPSFGRRTFAAIAVSVLILSVVGGYFALSYGSVVGTQLELVKVSRSVGLSSVPVSFELDIRLRSSTGFLDTYVDDPLFSLTVDNLLFGTVKAPQRDIRPGTSASYNLKFQNSEIDIASAIASRDTNNLVLTISCAVDAGWYREALTRSLSGAWTH